VDVLLKCAFIFVEKVNFSLNREMECNYYIFLAAGEAMVYREM